MRKITEALKLWKKQYKYNNYTSEKARINPDTFEYRDQKHSGWFKKTRKQTKMIGEV